MTNLIDGKFDVALTSIDNLIAYQEGQGEAPVKTPPDMVAFMGMDNAFLYLITAPQVKTFADLRDKEVSVDAMSTGFAFVLREMINRSGVKESEVTYVRAGGSPNRFRMLLEGKHAARCCRRRLKCRRRSAATTSCPPAWICWAITWDAVRLRSACG